MLLPDPNNKEEVAKYIERKRKIFNELLDEAKNNPLTLVNNLTGYFLEEDLEDMMHYREIGK